LADVRLCLDSAPKYQYGLKTRAIDIAQAFVSASLGPDDHIYVDMPRGVDTNGKPFAKDGYIYKLQRSLYGLRQSPQIYFDYLKSVLTDPNGLNFQQLTFDPCLFIKDGLLIVVYVDDLLLYSLTNEKIDEAIAGIKKVFEITEDNQDQEVFERG